MTADTVAAQTFSEFQSEWHANSRQSLQKTAEFLAPWTTEVEHLRLQLQYAVEDAKLRFLEDAPNWGRSGFKQYQEKRKRGYHRHMQVRSPPQYFEPFARKVVDLLHEFFAARAQEEVSKLKQRVHDNTEGYWTEFRSYADREHSFAFGHKRIEEELYIYEPLQFFAEEQQQVMKDIIRNRLMNVSETILHADEPEADDEGDLDAELERQRCWLANFAAARILKNQLDKEQRQRDFAAKKEKALADALVAAELAAREHAEKEALVNESERQELEHLQQELEEMQTKIEGTETDCLQCEEEIAQLEQEARDARAAVEALQEQAEKHRRRAQELEDAAKALQADYAARLLLEESRAQDPSKLSLSSAEQAQLKRLIAEFVGEVRRRIDAERAILLKRIKDLKDEIARLKALLAEATPTATPRPVPKAAPVLVVTVAWKPKGGGTRAIYQRLFKDAGHRQTRSIRAQEVVEKTRRPFQAITSELPSAPTFQIMRHTMNPSSRQNTSSTSTMPASTSLEQTPLRSPARRSTSPASARRSMDTLPEKRQGTCSGQLLLSIGQRQRPSTATSGSALTSLRIHRSRSLATLSHGATQRMQDSIIFFGNTASDQPGAFEGAEHDGAAPIRSTTLSRDVMSAWTAPRPSLAKPETWTASRSECS